MTFFNYDNYEYSEETSAVSNGGEKSGPLNPNIPLYQSSPTWIECNPQPDGKFLGRPYSTGVLFDNTSQVYVNFDLDNEYYFGSLFGEMDYYLFAGGSPASVLNELTTITGRTYLKPRWSLGYHQAGFGPNYNTRDGILRVAQAYRDARIPIDGLHIDIDILDNDRQFSVSKKRFPDIEGMFRLLHEMGYKLSTNVTPTIGTAKGEDGSSTYPPLDSGREKKVFITNRRFDGAGDDSPFDGQINYGGSRRPPVHVPDFGKEEVQEWWGGLYEHWTNLGLDMVWQDMTTPCLGNDALRSLPMDCMVWDNEDTRFDDATHSSQKVPFGRVRNLFAFNLCKATFEGLSKLRPNLRNFIIARGGFIGEHRYAGTWTGDNKSDWEFLIINIPQVLNMGLSAQPVAGSDIGGYGGSQCDGEMLVRWTTLGAFLPWFRNHYGHHNTSKFFQEPFREEYGTSVRAVCRKYIELRYRLLQVFYDAMYENHLTGMPIARPLFLQSHDPAIFGHHDWWYHDITGARSFHYNSCRLDDQFFVGPNLLIAPLILPSWVTGQRPERPVYLPAGSQWYAFKDNRFPLEAPVDGGQQFSYYAPWDNGGESFLNNVPIYVREGAIIPSREIELYVGELERSGADNPITLSVYPGEYGIHKLYLDDGNSTGAERERQYRLVEIEQKATPEGRTVRLRRLHDNFQPREHYCFVALLDFYEPRLVTTVVEEKATELIRIQKPTDEEASRELWLATESSYYYNRSVKSTFIKVFEDQDAIEIRAYRSESS
ncbi:glycosyl hydrolase family 31 [Methylobacterium sp. DM1]|nr:glycosyl hydrolase family 31 [Methylobacterium sp. DM1]